jgi:hypothetical protein
MTDSSSLANILSEPLRQPYWWAALASVSLHGVFGATAPTISNIIYGGGNSSKNIPGSVGLVELTPTEAGRLPQTIPPRPSNKPFLIAPVPLRPSPKLAAPLPPAPPTINLPALPPGMPPPGFFSPLPYPPLPPSPAPTAPPPPKTPSPSLNTPPQKQPTVIPQLPASQPSVNLDRNIPPPPPSSPSLRELPNFSAGPAAEDERETLARRIAEGAVPGLSDPNQINFPDYYQPQGRNSEGAEVGTDIPKNPDQRNEIPETPPQIARGQLEPLGSNLPPDRETQLAAANTYYALFERFKKAYPDLEMTGPTPVNVPYPQAACSQKLEGTAVFGAVVTPVGLLRAVPEPIVPTGYPILDNTAKTAIISPSLTFQAASTHKLYQLAVPFKYDEKVCSGIPVTPSTPPTRPNSGSQQPPAVAPTAPSRPTSQPPSPASTEDKPPAPSTKPQPAAKPSPPAPKPAAPASPSPQPKPAAEQSPEPGPQPAQESPQPETTPSPAPQVSPEPEATPSPAPEETPQREATPSPAPQVSPEPEATPSPAPEESPSPAPSPSPAATTEN